MWKKGTKLYSVVRFKCPHCHEGDFFVDRNPYHLATAGDLLDNCPVCARRYTPEPGFYFGGMYVTYAMGVVLFMTIYTAMLLLAPGAPLWANALVVLAAIVGLSPLLYALSKIIWGNLFISYKGVARTEEERKRMAERKASVDKGPY